VPQEQLTPDQKYYPNLSPHVFQGQWMLPVFPERP